MALPLAAPVPFRLVNRLHLTAVFRRPTEGHLAAREWQAGGPGPVCVSRTWASVPHHQDQDRVQAAQELKTLPLRIDRWEDPKLKLQVALPQHLQVDS